MRSERSSPISSRSWTPKRLGDLVELRRGVSYRSDDLNGDGGLVGLRAIAPGGGFRRDGLKPYSGPAADDQHVSPGDLVIAITDLTQTGSVLGAPARIPHLPIERLVISLDVARVDSRSGADSRFVQYMFEAPAFKHWVDAHASGTTVRRVKPSEILNFSQPVPSRAEQQRIAEVLVAIDELIECNRELGRKLEATAQSIFETTIGRYVEQSTDPIPPGWDQVELRQIAFVNPKVSIPKGDETPFISMALLDSFATRPRSIGSRPYVGGARFERGDTLFARITPCAEHGKGAFVDFLDQPGAGSTEFIVLRARERITPEALYLLTRNERLRRRAIAHMTGSSGRQRIPTDVLESTSLALPRDLDDWRQTAEFLSATFSQSLHLWNMNRRLRTLRDLLLPGLVSGSLAVNVAEAAFSEAS